MGSGCTTNTSSYLFQKNISDKTVIYTGPPIPSLGICTGDTLAEIEAVILQNIVNFSTGKGIHIPDIDLSACGLFVDYVTCCNGCDELDCLMKIIFESLCTLYTDFTDLQALVDALLNGPYNTGCLTGLGNNPTLNQIIQQLINQYCLLQTQVNNLQTQVNNLTIGLPTTIGNFLLNAISSCSSGNIIKTGTGASANIEFRGFTPIGGIIMYEGSLSYFDTNGNGLPNTPMCGWRLLNGNNGRQDARGRVPVCTIAGMGGGALDATVDPANPTNSTASPSVAYSIGNKGGQALHQLTVPELAQHAHAVYTPINGVVMGSLGYYTVSRKHASTGDNTMGYACDGGGTSTPCPSAPNATIPLVGNFPNPGLPATVSQEGKNIPHENRQPYIAFHFIQRYI
jgi:microcystin-dependent protein